MSPFRRKGKEADPETEPTTATEEPDPAAWALPADAGAVTSDAGTAPTATATADPEPEREAEPGPEPAAAAGPDPWASPAWTPPPAVEEAIEQRPELLVVGAFAGAFLFAQILKRITSD